MKGIAKFWLSIYQHWQHF